MVVTGPGTIHYGINCGGGSAGRYVLGVAWNPQCHFYLPLYRTLECVFQDVKRRLFDQQVEKLYGTEGVLPLSTIPLALLVLQFMEFVANLGDLALQVREAYLMGFNIGLTDSVPADPNLSPPPLVRGRRSQLEAIRRRNATVFARLHLQI